MTFNTIHFTKQQAHLVRRAGLVSAPIESIHRDSLPIDQQANWDTAIGALPGLLNPDETLEGVFVETAPQAEIAWDKNDKPTAYCDTLHVIVCARMANGGRRRIVLNTQEFTSTPARAALLALWAHLS